MPWNQWKQARWLVFQGLVIVFVLLGHDLLMASVAYAAPAPSDAGSAVLHHGGKVTADLADKDRAPAHPRSCDTTTEAVIAADPDRDAVALGAPATPFDDEAREPTTRAPQRWMEPRWPPGTSRAMLQVYRM